MASGDGTVGKALEVLDLIARFGRPVKFAELQGESVHPKATLYRLVQTLANQGMLTHDPDTGTYSLGIRLVRLAHAAWHTTSLAPVARPHLDALARAAGQTVHLAQLDNAQVLYVDKRSARDPVEMFSQAGKVGPAYCTGVGKAMLAWLPEQVLQRFLPQQSFHQFTPSTLTSEAELRAELEAIRDRGHAYDREEHEPGIVCVAVPVLSPSARVLGAISVTGSTARTDLGHLEALLPELKKTAARVAEEATAWAFPVPVAANSKREGPSCPV
ncbi:IclR family transcriptional regulator [Actibacterium sp. 188UL27-1]|uniref:IclR family transcriptional regulator n=1 Tax=Actibacterium sp. 188UL27-1 TaxID=2786961 RepID=UPI00195705DB|nr:IclR family transcriptional regulator [Actibacterium sp. 188UL27-1]MBM7066292.1 IclR family transcriptional regulator [Actibacterium sp. 188UL27-1]